MYPLLSLEFSWSVRLGEWKELFWGSHSKVAILKELLRWQFWGSRSKPAVPRQNSRPEVPRLDSILTVGVKQSSNYNSWTVTVLFNWIATGHLKWPIMVAWHKKISCGDPLETLSSFQFDSKRQENIRKRYNFRTIWREILADESSLVFSSLHWVYTEDSNQRSTSVMAW